MAGLIPQPFIDDLLARVDIVDVVDGRVKLKKTGKNYSACCPFHDEKTPSFSVSPDKQFFYCFGCGAGGNAIGFVMEYDHLGFPEAVEALAKTQGLEVPREDSGKGRAPRRNHQAEESLNDVLAQASKFYRYQLAQHPQAKQAIDYLKGRGLSGAIAKDFQIGFAPPGWENLKQAIGTSDKRLRDLETSGMLIRHEEKDSLYDRFRHRIMFPIRDHRGRIVAFGGRVLGDDKPKYLNSPETPVFSKSRELYGLWEARQKNRSIQRLMLVEGYMDVVALAQFGIHYAVATLGTAATGEHLSRIFRQCPEVVFCFDGDAAGRKAARRALENVLPLMEDGREARFLFLPDGEDPDSLVRQEGKEDFERRIGSATPLSDYLFETLSEDFDPATPAGKAQLSKACLPYLQRLPLGIFRNLMYKELSARTGVSVDELHAVEPVELPTPPEPQAPQAEAAPQRDAAALSRRSLTPAEQAVGLLLNHPRLLDKHDFAQLTDSDELKLLKEVILWLKDNPGAQVATLIGHWHIEQGADKAKLLAELAFRERIELVSDPDSELAGLLGLLRRQQLRRELNRLQDLARDQQLSPADKQRLRELPQLLQGN